MTNTSKLLLAGIASSLLATTASAADLRVAPVIIEPLPGSKTTTLTLINEEQRPLKAQIRVMRWTMENGREVLAPTQDVIASPPLVTLTPNQHYLVRLVRVAKTPPVGEESYRVLVDEVPDPANFKPGNVNLVLRQSIPAFFSDTPRRTAKVDWNVVREGSQLFLTGTNTGNRRIRLSDLSLNANGEGVYLQPGLVGYVLPGAEMRWPVTLTSALPADGKLTMKAMGDTGPLEVSLVVAPAA